MTATSAGMTHGMSAGAPQPAHPRLRRFASEAQVEMPLESVIRGALPELARIGDANREHRAHRVIHAGLGHEGVAVDRDASDAEALRPALEAEKHRAHNVAISVPPGK